MRKIASCLLIFFLALSVSPAQEARIIDMTDLQPVTDVFAYHATEISALSDQNGKLDLKGFPEGQPIVFQHQSYLSL